MLQRPARTQKGFIRFDGSAGFCAPQLRARLREDRQAQAAQRGRKPVTITHFAGDDQRPLRPLERRGQRRDLARRRQVPARADGLACRAERDWELTRCRHQGFAERKVDVHRPAGGLRISPRRQPAPLPGRTGRLDGRARIEEPKNRGSVEALLIDRLIGADIAELRGAIRGKDDQRST